MITIIYFITSLHYYLLREIENALLIELKIVKFSMFKSKIEIAICANLYASLCVSLCVVKMIYLLLCYNFDICDNECC